MYNVQKVWKHPNKIETNDFQESEKAAVFDDLESVMMSSEVFLNGNVAFLLPFLINILIVYPTVKNIFNLRVHKKFPEKTYFFYNITFSRSSKRPLKRKYQQQSFLKH
jgi:hypothetical protein